jgi:hypothetical protein
MKNKKRQGFHGFKIYVIREIPGVFFHLAMLDRKEASYVSNG